MEEKKSAQRNDTCHEYASCAYLLALAIFAIGSYIVAYIIYTKYMFDPDQHRDDAGGIGVALMFIAIFGISVGLTFGILWLIDILCHKYCPGFCVQFTSFCPFFVPRIGERIGYRNGEYGAITDAPV